MDGAACAAAARRPGADPSGRGTTTLNPTLQRLLSQCGLGRTFVRGQGVWLTDAAGRRFLDGYAQYGAVALGHNAPPVLAALQQALLDGTPAMVQPFRAHHAEALSDRLCRLSGLDRCVLVSTGAEAVEAAIKLVRARSGRPLIVSTHGSYHGKTLGALSATGQPQHSQGLGPLASGFVQVPFGDAAALRALLQREGDAVAAFLVEPIQGERGVHLPPPGYLLAVRRLCDEHGVALVVDEIQTGLYRTGVFLACAAEGVAPDVLVLAKALGGGLFPLGACLSAARWWDDGFGLRHSSTFANNNLSSRVGLAVLDALSQGGVGAGVAQKGERLQEGLRLLQRRYPRAVREVRGRGLLAALELGAPGPEAGALLSYLWHQGLLAYAVSAAVAERGAVLTLPTLGPAPVLRLAPPLVIDEEQIDRLLAALGDGLALLEEGDVVELLRAMGALDASAQPSPASAQPSPASAQPSPGGPLAAVPASPVSLPRPAPQAEVPGRCAFLIHPTSAADLVTTDPRLARLTPDELARYGDFAAALPPGVVVRAAPLRTRRGVAEALILVVPLTPQQMLRRGRRLVRDQIVAAVDLAAALGAGVVGLGGFTTPYARRGLDVIGRGPAITTGNSLTAVMAVRALVAAARARGLDLDATEVAVVGAAGSVGGLCARLLARAQPGRLWLLGNPRSLPGPLHALRDDLIASGASAVQVATELSPLLRCRLVLSATGAARPVLDGAPLLPGTIVCDVARPFDASPAVRARRDLQVLDGGLVALPDPTARFGAGNLQGLPDGVQLACLSETLLLAAAGVREDFGVGDEIPLSCADRIGALAQEHGFDLWEVHHAG